MRKTASSRTIGLALILAPLFASDLTAQARPYFVAYDPHLEEPGALEISVNPVFGSQRGGHDFVAS